MHCAGWTGSDCTSADACSSSPCQNDAPCHNEHDTYTCSCPPQFTGPLLASVLLLYNLSNLVISRGCRVYNRPHYGSCAFVCLLLTRKQEVVQKQHGVNVFQGMSRGVDPYGTGGHVPPSPPQYLEWGTLSRMSPSIFLE